jgi:hypothetical protein
MRNRKAHLMLWGRRDMKAAGNFPVLYGRRITNSEEFIATQMAVLDDIRNGRISTKEARAINRQASAIVKMFERQCKLTLSGDNT